MIDNLRMLVRFWGLVARSASLRATLTEGDLLELLEQLDLAAAEEVIPAGERSHSAGEIPVRLITRDGLFAGSLVHVGAGGLVVRTLSDVHPKDRFLVAVLDSSRGIDYLLPCRLGSLVPGERATLALVPDGIPSLVHFAESRAAASKPYRSGTYRLGEFSEESPTQRSARIPELAAIRR